MKKKSETIKDTVVQSVPKQETTEKVDYVTKNEFICSESHSAAEFIKVRESIVSEINRATSQELVIDNKVKEGLARLQVVENKLSGVTGDVESKLNSNLETRISEVSSELGNKLKSEITDIVDILKGVNSSLQEVMKQNEESLKKVGADVRSLTARLEVLEGTYSSLNDRLKKLEKPRKTSK